MKNKEFRKVLKNKTKLSAIHTMKLSTHLPNTPEGKMIRNQITKSQTAISLHFKIAHRLRSKSNLPIKLKNLKSLHLNLYLN